MSLSKVYSTQDTFKPEDIVRAKIHEPHVPSKKATAPGPEDQQDLDEPAGRDTAQPQPPPPRTPQQDTTDTREKPGEPAAPAETAVPPPPGVPLEEVQRMLADSYEKGVQDGIQQAEEDYGAATKSMLLICQQLDTLRETILKNSVGEMQDLVLVIAEKIIRHSVQEQNSTIVGTVEEAIHKAVKSEEFFIYVNPDDYEIVAARSEELTAGLNGLKNIVVKKDKAIERGGCRIDSDTCTVDATLASQLEIISTELKRQK